MNIKRHQHHTEPAWVLWISPDQVRRRLERHLAPHGREMEMASDPDLQAEVGSALGDLARRAGERNIDLGDAADRVVAELIERRRGQAG